jgi:hypothetical protein
VQAYPAVFLVLASIPLSIFRSASADEEGAIAQVLTSLWAALDARALGGLDKSAAHAALLSAVLDTLVFAMKRAGSGDGEWRNVLLGKGAVEGLMREQVGLVLGRVAAKELSVDVGNVGRILSMFLEGMKGEVLKGVLDEIRKRLCGSEDANRGVEHALLRALGAQAKEGSRVHSALKGIISEAAEQIIRRAEVAAAEGGEDKDVKVAGILQQALQGFAEEIFGDSGMHEVCDAC